MSPRRHRSQRPRAVWSWGGFAVASNIELPRLRRTSAKPDVQFVWREAPPPGRPAPGDFREITTAGGRMVRYASSREDDVARFDFDWLGAYLLGPGRIEFHPRPDADPSAAEHWLVNAVLATYAGLRGTVCLHAAAVARRGRAIVFAGPSRSGKSTAALRMIEQGWSLVADDQAVLRRRPQGWYVFPVARTLRLLAGEWDPPRAWANMGKTEARVSSVRAPARLGEIVLLGGGSADEADEPAAATAYRSLVGIQAGWSLCRPPERSALAARLRALCEEVPVGVRERWEAQPAVMSREPSPTTPKPPAVRSQTVPNGRTTGG